MFGRIVHDVQNAAAKREAQAAAQRDMYDYNPQQDMTLSRPQQPEPGQLLVDDLLAYASRRPWKFAAAFVVFLVATQLGLCVLGHIAPTFDPGRFSL